MVGIIRTLLISILLLTVCSPSIAATISVKTDRNPVGMNENFRITFTVDGSLDDEPDFSPLNKDFQLLGTSQSSQFNMINGTINRSKSFTLTVMPLHKGEITIPPISFGKDKSPAIKISVVGPGNSRQAPGQPFSTTDNRLMFITSEVDTKSPYVQQQVILKLKIYRLKQWAEASLSEAIFSGIEVRHQKLGKETEYTTRIKGQQYQVTELRYALFPQQSGDLTIKPFRVTGKFPAGAQQQNMPFGNMGNDPFFNNLFSRQTYEQKTAQTGEIKLKIKPIPASFKGKHWLPAKDIQLQENWSGGDINQLKVGEPVTRTLALIGDGVGSGQLPDITMKETAQLKNYPDQAVTDEKVSGKGLLSTRTQKFAVIPSQPGKQTIDAIEIPWWNTTADKMQIAKLPASTLIVSGKALPNPAQKVIPPTDAPVEAQANTDTQTTPAPTANSTVNTALLAAVIVLALLWLVTLYFLFRNKPSVTETENKTEEKKPDVKAALKNLHSACQNQQADSVRDALISWAKTHWPDNPPNSLEEIASRLPAGPAHQITCLSGSLYGKTGKAWDADAIWQAIQQLPETTTSNTDRNTSALEPLYR